MSNRVRPAWNDSPLGDSAGKYALSKQALLQRKRNLVSKHNVLQQRFRVSGPKSPPKFQKRPLRTENAKTKASNTRTYAVINDKIQFDGGEDVCSDEDDCDNTVLQLLHTPSKAGSTPPENFSVQTTPGAEDITHDMMKRFVASPDSQSERAPSFGNDSEDEGENDDNADDAHGEVVDDYAWELAGAVEMAKPRDRTRGGRAVTYSTGARNVRAAGATKVAQPAKRTQSARVRAQSRQSDAKSSVLETSTSSHMSKSSPSESTHARDAVELQEMREEISTLMKELQYYEQLSGRRSALEMDSELSDLAAAFCTDGGSTRQNLMHVVRTLTRLLCQTMTYLLKSEVELQEQRNRQATLVARMDTLTALVMPHSAGILTEPLVQNEPGHVTQATTVPAAPGSAFQNITSQVPKISSRVSEHILNGQVAAMREALSSETDHEAYLTKYYDAKKYGSIVNAAEDGCGSLNISLSEGFAQVEKVPFNVNLSPVRDGANSVRPPRPDTAKVVPAMRAQLTGSSTSDLLFGGRMSASLSEQVGQALHRASASALKVEEVVGTPTRPRPDLSRLALTDRNSRSYQDYQAAQRRLGLNDSSDSDSEEEPNETPMPYARREKPVSAFLSNTDDDDKYWSTRLGAVSTLSDGLLHLSAAVSTVKTASQNIQPGPYSSRTRSVVGDKNEVTSPRCRTPSCEGGSTDGMGVTLFPAQLAPTPTETPKHPFADITNSATARYARVGVNADANDAGQRASSARGRGTERTFQF